MRANEDEDTSINTAVLTGDKPPPPPPVDHPKSAVIFTKTLLFFTSIAISVTIAIIYTNRYLTKQLDQAATDIQIVQQELIHLKKQTAQDLINAEQQSKQQLANMNESLQSALHEHLYQANDWLLLKARYYLELASINGAWNDDPATSLALLKNADALLATLHQDNLTDVRRAIAQEETAWTQITPIDMTGLLVKLAAIQTTLDTLKPETPLASSQFKQQNPVISKQPSTWREHLQHSLQQLKNLVIIRHQDDLMTPLLTPAYVMVLRESIRLNLQETHWAMLEKNQTVYQLSITQAIENIKRIFGEKNQNTMALIDELSSLQAMKLTQEKPQTSQALTLLNKIIQSQPATTPASAQASPSAPAAVNEPTGVNP